MDNRRKKLILLAVLFIGCFITSLVNSSEVWTSLGAGSNEGGERSQFTGSKDKGKLLTKGKNKTREDDLILIQVNGAVNCPGRYLLPKTSRVEEAILMAGGLKEEANTEKLNMAKALKDGAMVYVPYKKQASRSSRSNKEVSSLAQEIHPKTGTGGGKERLRVNLNTATQQELEALPGIGPAMAQRVIAHRQAKAFGKIEELLEIRGIGKAKLEKLRPYLTL